jgi:hypothetical protein
MGSMLYGFTAINLDLQTLNKIDFSKVTETLRHVS